MSRRVSPPSQQATIASSGGGTRAKDPGLVSAAFDDSWSMLGEEVSLIDRLFGGEIAALFERHDNDRGNVRG